MIGHRLSETHAFKVRGFLESADSAAVRRTGFAVLVIRPPNSPFGASPSRFRILQDYQNYHPKPLPATTPSGPPPAIASLTQTTSLLPPSPAFSMACATRRSLPRARSCPPSTNTCPQTPVSRKIHAAAPHNTPPAVASPPRVSAHPKASRWPAPRSEIPPP